MILDILAILIIVVVALGFIVPISIAVREGFKKNATYEARVAAKIIVAAIATVTVVLALVWAINRLAG